MAPVYFRHWVKTTCRRLSDPTLAVLQGHKVLKDRSMRNTYDTPGVEAILEEQRTEFPHGALGVLKPLTIHVVDGLEAELALLREWKEAVWG